MNVWEVKITKNIKFITRFVFFSRSKCTKTRIRQGLPLDPVWEFTIDAPRPLGVWDGDTPRHSFFLAAYRTRRLRRRYQYETPQCVHSTTGLSSELIHNTHRRRRRDETVLSHRRRRFVLAISVVFRLCHIDKALYGAENWKKIVQEWSDFHP